MKAKFYFNIIKDMGSVNPIVGISNSQETAEENALWELNSMREHDGLKPLKRLPYAKKVIMDE
jgi:hypothetical protein